MQKFSEYILNEKDFDKKIEILNLAKNYEGKSVYNADLGGAFRAGVRFE